LRKQDQTAEWQKGKKMKERKSAIGLVIVLALLVLGLGTFVSKPTWLKQPMEIRISKAGSIQSFWFPTGGLDFRFWCQHNQGILITSRDLGWNSYRFSRILGKPGTHREVRPAIVVMPDGQEIALAKYLKESDHWKIFN
jgi:hypothetical protein